MEGSELERWRGKFERATWDTGTNCEKVKTALFDLFDKAESTVSGKTAELYFALPKDNDSDFAGSYWGGLNDSTEHLVVVRKDLTDARKIEFLLHEAAHHAGFEHSDNWNPYNAQSCAEEKEDDPGGGGGENTGDDDPTCTTTIEWKKAYRYCTYWTGPSGLPHLHVCIEEILIPVEVTICTT
ncbi:hypothetical protein [Candidatus Palauibacter sp.]|uniref:hypothetical protein n=1 Tax=Candidatus Palauibacter sp. TaxID=3101350 RepID=UPI003B51EC40